MKMGKNPFGSACENPSTIGYVIAIPIAPPIAEIASDSPKMSPTRCPAREAKRLEDSVFACSLTGGHDHRVAQHQHDDADDHKRNEVHRVD